MHAVLLMSWKQLTTQRLTCYPSSPVAVSQGCVSSNPVMKALWDTIRRVWPPSKSGISESVYPYFDIWDELVIQDNLIFEGLQIVIPATVQKEMMSVTHASHNDIEGCIRRAQESIYWPRTSSELKEHILKCDKCMAHRTTPGRSWLCCINLQHVCGQKWGLTYVIIQGRPYW